jgi:type IV secretion system protein VirB5
VAASLLPVTVASSAFFEIHNRRRIEMRRLVTGAVASIVLHASAAAQGIPVIDVSAIAQAIQQLQQMQAQLGQLQQTHASFNKLTSMGDIAAILNKPDVRRALPPDFGTAQSALLGQGADAFKSSDGIYVNPASDDYATRVNRQRDGIAGQKSVGQQMYDAASKRIDGIETLRRQISQTEDPKTISDLQTRIQTEIAAANTDTLRMQALAMVVRAEEHQEDLRRAQDFEQSLQKQIDTLRGNGGTP